MYYLKKKLSFAAAHKLELDYDSPCKNLHGHEWNVTVYCKAFGLDANGMIIDFKKIKKIVNQLDHKYINDIVDFNPTAENLAKWLCDQIPFCYKIDLEESANNLATYEIF